MNLKHIEKLPLKTQLQLSLQTVEPKYRSLLFDVIIQLANQYKWIAKVLKDSTSPIALRPLRIYADDIPRAAYVTFSPDSLELHLHRSIVDGLYTKKIPSDAIRMVMCQPFPEQIFS